MKFNKNIGMILLAVFLILYGAIFFLNISGLGPVMAGLAIAAGIFILLGK